MKNLFIVYDALDEYDFKSSVFRGAIYHHLPGILSQDSVVTHAFPLFGNQCQRPFQGLICSNSEGETRWLEPHLDPPWNHSPEAFRLLVLGDKLPSAPNWWEFLWQPGYLPSIHMLPPPASGELTVLEYDQLLFASLREVVAQMVLDGAG